MRQGASMLAGIHDFAAFRSVHCEAPTTVRHIRQVAVRCADEVGGVRLLEIEVDGNAFLHNMVRIFAGTLIDIGRRRKTLQQLGEALDSGDRTRAGQTAPAHGLTLDDVFYGPWGARQGQDYKDLLDHMERARGPAAAAAMATVSADGRQA
jgi:tRNA pseudouridine38-40 synthase